MANIDDQLKFQNSFNRFIDDVILNSKQHGNWPKDEAEAYDDLNEEFQEFMECYHGLNSKSCVEDELADIILSAIIYASKKGFDLPQAIVNKHNYNLTRPFGHKRQKVA